MENQRYRIMARIPKGQGDPPEVVRSKTRTDYIFTCSDPDIEWYKDNVPCRRACPAETRIPEYLDASSRGDYDRCFEINREDNILPHTLGRVCAHPCEAVCRHGFEGMGESVSICWMKRTGADFKTRAPELSPAPATGKKVAVIGSGPAGLAAAQDLALWGHAVTLYEGMEKPGGMLRYGIPRFRLPEELIDEEIQQVLDLGVTLKTGQWIDKDGLEKLTKENDAVIMAAGSMVPSALNIPGEDADRVIPGLDFMGMVNKGELTEVKGRVIIVGGGFTAMDCARSAWRLGADDVTIIYRRSRNELKVDEREMKETQLEGVKFGYLMSPVEIKRSNHNTVQEVVFRRNILGEPDASGRRGVVPMEGSEVTEQADWLIPAVSQTPDTSYFGDDFTINDDYSTHIDKVYATGDYITGPRDIISAIGVAHKTARSVDNALTGRDRFKEHTETHRWERRPYESFRGWKAVEANIFDLVPRKEMPSLSKKERRDQLKEADTGYDKEDAFWQGTRCYLCNHNIQIDGNECILCYNCVDVCPYTCIYMLNEENVKVSRDGLTEREREGYTYMVMDEEKCVRCGLCMDVCPVPCITMEKMEVTRAFTG